MSFTVALIGNPNCGKTTIFNLLTNSKEYVGNRAGVTVEAKTGRLKGNPDITITDLPGIYSLSPYTSEEIITEKYISETPPDVILNVADASGIERSLYLTTWLAEKGIPVVLMLNMWDFAQKRGIEINVEKLSQILRIETVTASAARGEGVFEAIETALKAEKSAFSPNLSFVFGSSDEETIIAKRYDFVEKTVRECVRKPKARATPTERLDRILTGKFTAFPCFFAIMTAIYFLSAGSLGAKLSGALTNFIVNIFGGAAENFLLSANAADWAISLVCEGIIGGVGSVLGFFPQLALLFFMLSLLEDFGYMARVTFILDRFFRFFGLSGKSFIPMLIATGCGVPAIMSSRTIDNPAHRKMTIITSTFMPCSAKLPVISMISSLFFGGRWWVAPLCYVVGIAAVLISGLILKNLPGFESSDAPFLVELPEYRLPVLKNVMKTVSERVFSFVGRAGTVILLASVVIWFLSKLEITSLGMRFAENPLNSIVGRIGDKIAVFFVPLGFGDWRAAVASIMGLLAKEEIVGFFGVVGTAEEVFKDSLSAFSFLVFNLLCTPCIAAAAAISRELRSVKATVFAFLYQTAFAYSVSLVIYQFGLFFNGGEFSVFTLAASGVVIFAFFSVLRKAKKQ